MSRDMLKDCTGYAVQTRSFTLHVRATIDAVAEEATACVETKGLSEGDTVCYFN